MDPEWSGTQRTLYGQQSRTKWKESPPHFSQIKGGKIAHFGFQGGLSLISRGLGFVVLFQSI